MLRCISGPLAVEAARAHRSETRRLDALRARRDEAVAATYSELVEIRRQARRLYGKRAPTVLGLRGRTRRKPYPLARQAGTAVYCLSEPLTESRASSGLEVRRQAWLEALEPLHDLLEPATEAVVRGKAATQVTLQTKDQAIKDFDKHFGNVGRYVQCAYRLVGLDELAARVPPREPRKSRRRRVGSLGTISRQVGGTSWQPRNHFQAGGRYELAASEPLPGRWAVRVGSLGTTSRQVGGTSRQAR